MFFHEEHSIPLCSTTITLTSGNLVYKRKGLLEVKHPTAYIFLWLQTTLRQTASKNGDCLTFSGVNYSARTIRGFACHLLWKVNKRNVSFCGRSLVQIGTHSSSKATYYNTPNRCEAVIYFQKGFNENKQDTDMWKIWFLPKTQFPTGGEWRHLISLVRPFKYRVCYFICCCSFIVCR